MDRYPQIMNTKYKTQYSVTMNEMIINADGSSDDKQSRREPKCTDLHDVYQTKSANASLPLVSSFQLLRNSVILNTLITM